MALSRLAVEEMVAVNSRWVDSASPSRAIIAASPYTKPYLTQIDALDPRLGSAQRATVKSAPYSGEAKALDGEHDFWLHLIVDTCTTVHPSQPELGLEETVRWLFPRGHMHAQDTYGVEVGYAKQKALEIDPPRKKQLKAIVFGKQTLWEWVENWLGAAQKLGELEARLAEAAPVSTEDPRAVRSAWLSMVKGLLSAAKSAAWSDEEHNTVFGLLQEYSARRVIRKNASTNPGPVMEPLDEEPTGTTGEEGKKK